ncbi:hypothetical protein GO730_29440 [Spirosoma sp. HMF3257]|nr:hypothetical protein [Spirosoma telluris]
MKHNRSFFALFIMMVNLSITGFTQQPQKVSIRLKNNSLLPREFKFLERHPADKYPNVFTTYLLPGQSYAVSLKVGTSLALVTQPEINATMRGRTYLANHFWLLKRMIIQRRSNSTNIHPFFSLP